tara:strand:+ start:159 stop:368 length:210 start_codon:yes stop_codon:yes gene_type:complete
MAVGMCSACDEFADESEFDWDLELCWDCAADREEEEEEEYNSDDKYELLEEARLELLDRLNSLDQEIGR